MKLIIDIPEDVYKPIIKAYKKDKELQTRPNLYKAIANGIPIPKGLEPLITKLIEDAKEVENG